MTLTKQKKPIYIFSQGIKYRNFYRIWKCFPNEGIVPQEMISGKIVHQMIKNKELLVYIDPKQSEDPVIFAMKLPRNRDIMLLTNPK